MVYCLTGLKIVSALLGGGAGGSDNIDKVDNGNTSPVQVCRFIQTLRIPKCHPINDELFAQILEYFNGGSVGFIGQQRSRSSEYHGQASR